VFAGWPNRVVFISEELWDSKGGSEKKLSLGPLLGDVRVLLYLLGRALIERVLEKQKKIG